VAPEGLEVKKGEACLLKKALYGTMQAARCWWQHLSKTLNGLGYVSSQYNGSVYVLSSIKGNHVTWIHVDNGIITAPNSTILRNLGKALSESIEIKWSDNSTDIVGLKVERSVDGVQVSQPKLIASILKGHWDGSSVAKTPLPTSSLPTTHDGEGVRTKDYLSVIGSLSYVSAGSRPDITFAVNFLERFSKNPGQDHWRCLNHLLNYVAGTQHEQLFLCPDKASPQLSCFTDANWGGKFSRSTFGNLVLLHGCPISWTSKRLVTVAASTAHAEYMAMGHGTRLLLWIRELVKDMTGHSIVGRMFCDNQAAVKICSNDMSNKQTRHTNRDFYITNQALFNKQISLTWVPTTYQFADVFTKNLTPIIHKAQLRVVLGRVLARGGVL
jgi:hypothetical protein